MLREVSEIENGSGTRHMVRMEDEPCDISQKLIRQFEFLESVVRDGKFSGLLRCGNGWFERMFMYYENGRWVIELEKFEEKHV